MPHSTTGTTSYVLVKYSRAYPTKRTLQHTQTGSDLVSEWQHFTNPTIRLVLDVKSTLNGGIESVRLRILWQINSEPDAGCNNQQDVVFASLFFFSEDLTAQVLRGHELTFDQEDLDLLSFSFDAASGASRKQTQDGLPLKAVYRDTVVGIRYLCPRDGLHGAMTTYRRFQISFRSAAEASEFIDSIKPVCPCKLNPTPVQGHPQTHSQIVSRPAPAAQNNRAFVTRNEQPIVSHPSSSSHQRGTQAIIDLTNRPQQISNAPTPYALSSSPLRHSHTDNQTPILPTSSNPLTAAESTHTLTPANQLQSQTHTVAVEQQQAMQPPTVCANSVTQTDLPASSLPTSSASVCGSTQRQGAGATSGNLNTAAGKGDLHPILASVADSASIYNLPAHTLERVVGEVIREEGFIQLVERLSEMFTIRKIANV